MTLMVHNSTFVISPSIETKETALGCWTSLKSPLDFWCKQCESHAQCIRDDQLFLVKTFVPMKGHCNII